MTQLFFMMIAMLAAATFVGKKGGTIETDYYNSSNVNTEIRRIP